MRHINHAANPACCLMGCFFVLVYRPIRARRAAWACVHVVCGLSRRDGEELKVEKVKSNRILPDAKSKWLDENPKLYISFVTFFVTTFKNSHSLVVYFLSLTVFVSSYLLLGYQRLNQTFLLKAVGLQMRQMSLVSFLKVKNVLACS